MFSQLTIKILSFGSSMPVATLFITGAPLGVVVVCNNGARDDLYLEIVNHYFPNW